MMPIAQAILVAAALYFIALGVVALRHPAHAQRFLLGFAGSAAKHYLELCARFLVGGSLLLVATGSAHPTPLLAAGWLLVGTTAVMTLVPWRAHERFARAAVPKALHYLPLIGVASLALGGLLLWSLFTASCELRASAC